MSMQFFRYRGTWIGLGLLMLIGLFGFNSPGGNDEGKERSLELMLLIDPNCLPEGSQLQLDCPAPPNTNLTAQPDFDFFAWNTFIALNWPALVPGDNNNQRGFPNLDSSFVNAYYNDLLVWETFKEKREVFNIGGGNNDPGDWNSKVNYGPLRPANSDTSLQPVAGMRTFHQSSKVIFNSFDETIEVASEALEDTVLNGVANPVLNRPVGPRVWKGEPSAKNPVVYEVKVNYDFYKYLRKHGLYNDTTAAGLAVEGNIQLPYRTSAGYPKKPGYLSQNVLNDYKKVTSMTDSLPPSIGSVHIKAGWIYLSDAEAALGKYHTTRAQYFVTNGGIIETDTATFGLIGLHIIQRIHTGMIPTTAADSTGKNKIGGTFIFATWEHTGNDTANFTYSNYYDSGNDPKTGFKPNTGWYPHVSGSPLVPTAYPVIRKYQPISQAAPKPLGTHQVNKAVHDSISAHNPNSVWLNYRLIGTQFMAVDVDSMGKSSAKYPKNEYDPTGIGQPFYMANLVIETNEGLQHFQGLPPQVFPIGHYKTQTYSSNLKDNNTVNFQHSFNNLAFDINGSKPGTYTMGGCMGCHGVAQLRGFSFSFVLLGGSDGAKTDTEMEFDIPAPAQLIWTDGRKINNVDSTPKPLATSNYRGKIYSAWKENGSSNRIYVSGTNDPLGGAWPAGTMINSVDSTPEGLAMAVYNNSDSLLLLAWENGTSNRIYISGTKKPLGGAWPAGKTINSVDSTPEAPAMAVFNDSLWLAWKENGSSNRIYISGTNDPLGGAWPAGKIINSVDLTPASPALAAFSAGFLLTWKENGSANRIYFSNTTNPLSDWPIGKTINSVDSTPDALALGIFNGTVYMMWKANDSSNRIYISAFAE